MPLAITFAAVVVFAAFASRLVKIRVSYGRYWTGRSRRTWVIHLTYGRWSSIQFGRMALGGPGSAHLYVAKRWVLALNEQGFYPCDGYWKTLYFPAPCCDAVPQGGLMSRLHSTSY